LDRDLERRSHFERQTWQPGETGSFGEASVTKEQALEAISREFDRAVQKRQERAKFNSLKEGWAVVHFELEESRLEIQARNTEASVEEMTQAGAMACRYLVDFGNAPVREDDVEEKEIETREAKRERQLKSLENQLSSLLNCYCQENASNTPDFILATFMLQCMRAFNQGVSARDGWYGVNLKPGRSADPTSNL
jgi:hypothetical protein